MQLYTEPKDYHAARKRHVLHRRDFDLTEEVFGFAAIPGATFLLREEKNVKAVFLLGYEGQRLDQALEQAPLKPSNCSLIFGVPAFQPGWEMDAFANNIRIIRERGIRGGVRFCGAQSVLGAYEQIREVFQTRREGERLLIAPIGTKPHGIAAALIACEEEVGLLYDHPRRTAKGAAQISQCGICLFRRLGLTNEESLQPNASSRDPSEAFSAASSDSPRTGGWSWRTAPTSHQ